MKGQNLTYVPGELTSAAVDGVVASAEVIKDYRKGKSIEEVNREVDDALGERYTKEETYSREQLDSLITTPDTEVVVVEELPESGEANTIYRVAGSGSYTEYAWDGTQFVLLATRDNGIDNSALVGDSNLVTVDTLLSGLSDFRFIKDNQIVKGLLTSTSQMSGTLAGRSETQDYKSLVIPLRGNEYIEIYGNESYALWYSLFSSFSYPNYVVSSSMTAVRAAISAKKKKAFAANGAKYLFIIVRNTVDNVYVDIMPKKILIDGVDYLSSIPKEMNKIQLAMLDVNADDVEEIVTDGFKAATFTANYDTVDGYEVRRVTNVFLQEGARVHYHIFYKGNEAPIFVVYDRLATLFPDDPEHGEQYQGYVVWEVDADSSGEIKLYDGFYTATQDCYILSRGIFSSDENYNGFIHVFPKTQYEKGFVQINPATKFHFDTSTRTVLFDNLDGVNSYVNWGCVVHIKDRVHYMYYEGHHRSYGRGGVNFAYTTDGFNWVRALPPGVEPIVPNTNFLFPLEPNSYNEGRYEQKPVVGFNVIKVADPVYPFRMIGQYCINNGYNKSYAPVYWWKSKNGIRWEGEKMILFENADTQFSMIAYGDTIKVYLRMWQKKRGITQQKTVGIMYLDLEGNMLTPPSTPILEGEYLPAAFKLDNRRELMLPTSLNMTNDNNTYSAYIVEDNNKTYKISTTPSINSQLVSTNSLGDADYWGTVNPGFIFVGERRFITYNVRNTSHGIDRNFSGAYPVLDHYTTDSQGHEIPVYKYYKKPTTGDGKPTTVTQEMRMIELVWDRISENSIPDMAKPETPVVVPTWNADGDIVG